MDQSTHNGRRLAGLVCGMEGCFLYGDEVRTIIDVRPLSPPLVVIKANVDATYSTFSQTLHTLAPPGSNAFYLGGPAFRYKNRRYFDVALQFCSVAEVHWHKALSLRHGESLMNSYFPAQVGGPSP